MPLIKSNATLIADLVHSNRFSTPHIQQAFKVIDRGHFVPTHLSQHAYDDQALPIGYQQTISQPTTVAIMLQLLAPIAGDCVLDIGSGSGWTTGLLGWIVGSSGQVLGLEIVPELVEIGCDNLSNYLKKELKGIDVVIRKATGTIGVPGRQFDKILVSAAAIELPLGLLDQVAIGGCLVIPIGESIHVFHKTETAIEEKIIPGFVFVPLKDSY